MQTATKFPVSESNIFNHYGEAMISLAGGVYSVSFYDAYEYEDRPLVFLGVPGLPTGIFHDSSTKNAGATLQLLRLFESLYGDTDQETTDWALEFEVLTRNLIYEGNLLVNPAHLDWGGMPEEDAQWLDELLGDAAGDFHILHQQLTDDPNLAKAIAGRWNELNGGAF